MALTSCNDASLRERPDCDQVVLASGHDVLSVGGPAHTYQATVVATKDIQYAGLCQRINQHYTKAAEHTLLSNNPGVAASRHLERLLDACGLVKRRSVKFADWPISRRRPGWSSGFWN